VITFPKGTEKALAKSLMARTKAIRSLLHKRLTAVLSRPDATAADVAAVLEQTRRTLALMETPKVSPLMNTAMGVQDATARAVVAAVGKARGQDLSQDLRLQVARLQRESQRVEWAQRVLAQQQRVEREMFERLTLRARTALEQGQAQKVLELADEQAEQADGRLRLLARHELGNLVATVTQETSQALGVRRYRWTSERDERVRPLHKKLDGTIRSWDDPHPSEGHPGQVWACRCTAQPVVDEVPAAVPAKPLPAPQKPPEAPRPPPAVVAPPRPSPRPVERPARPRRPAPVAPPPPPRAPSLPALPALPPLPVRPPLPVLPALPSWPAQPLPSFPGASGLAPIPAAPVLAPRSPAPVLPELTLPSFPPRPPPVPVASVEALAQRSYREFRRSAEAEVYGAELEALRGELTQTEEAAVGAYTGAHYGAVNTALRTGKTHRLVPALDAAIDKAVIPADIVVRRGLNSHPNLGDVDLIRPGDILHEPAYTSTSLSLARSFAGKYQLKIRVPAGSKALWVDDISDNPGELELILARGSRLQVLGTEDIGGSVLIDCILLPRP
jgi:SPP1 gp7 family putative phage head morphogenesis protein